MKKIRKIDCNYHRWTVELNKLLTIVVGSEMYPSYSSSDDEEESIFSCLVSGNLQTICAKSMNVYLNKRITEINESLR